MESRSIGKEKEVVIALCDDGEQVFTTSNGGKMAAASKGKISTMFAAELVSFTIVLDTFRGCNRDSVWLRRCV